MCAAWRRSLLLLALLEAAIIVGYGRTGLAMVEIWDRSGTFAHAWVVPPIALWLIWRQRAALTALRPGPSPLFVLPFAVMALLWLVADMAAVNVLSQFAFVAILVLAVPAVLGRRVAWQIAFPLAFLFFCVPAGEFVMPQLMEWTADVTVAALRLTGVPVYREGLQFVIPSGSWSVVEACSGIRYLIASVMVGTLFAYLNYRKLKRRLIFIGVAALLPLVANWMRAYMIVMLGHLSDNRIATGVDHLIYGWVFFGIVMLALFLIGARWAEPDVVSGPSSTPARDADASAGRAFAVPVLLALLVATPPLLAARINSALPSAPPVLARPDLSSRGWEAGPTAVTAYVPAFVAPMAEFHGSFHRRGEERSIGLYVAYYRNQSYDSKLISSDNVVVHADDHTWAAVEHGALPVGERRFRTTLLRGSPLAGNGAPRRLRVAQSYWVNGNWTPSDLRAKADGVLERLSGRGDDGAAVIVYVEEDGELGAGEPALTGFLRDNADALDSWLKGARSSGLGDNRTSKQ
nr:exosortase A [Pelomonas sp. KK5]